MLSHAVVLRDRVGHRGAKDQKRERAEPGDQRPCDARQPRERAESYACCHSGGQPGHRHADERLGVSTRQLLERKRTPEPWAEREHVKLAQEIEPAGPGGDGDEHRPESPERTRSANKRLKRWGLAAIVLAWAVAGIYGVTSYGHNYYRYRGFPAPRTPRGVPAGKVVKVNFFSPALGRRRSYLIYLPPGYSAAAARGTRFPVLYFLHGSPGWPSLVLNAGHLGVDADVLLHQHRIRPFLIVMPDGRNGTFRSDTEWADTRHGSYEGFVLDVVRAVDSRWSTIANRSGRAVSGNSEGAYAAINLTLRHLDTFAVAESWSGYVKPTVKNGPFAGEPAARIAANDPALYLPRVAPSLHRLPVHMYVYSGTQDHSARQVGDFAKRLRAAGGDVTFSLFPGGHNWRVWRQHAPLMLEYASSWLAR